MSEIEQMLERQARWQQSRAKLSWAEKLRLAETLRDAALALGCGQRKQPRPKPAPNGAHCADGESPGILARNGH